jgi:signal transduction histidine kinase
MGVTTDKMGEAARAVQALSALNFEGSQAAKAVALAMDGNMLGFQRMIPALRNAKTESEKVAAVNKVLAAGYEQQKANLNTVGGAWEALKGRIGDAREDIVGAIFEGFALGKTFNSMQAAVGRFLKSDTFNDFTERLKSGADYVTQIVKAMSVKGGTKEVLANMANVIVAAFKRGGEIVAEKILSAFRPMKDARALWKNRGLVGSVMRGSPIDVAGQLLTKYTDRNNQSGTDGQRELDAALKAFSKTIKENAKEYEQLHDRTEDENELARKSLESENNRLEVSERTFLSEKAAAERDKEILEKKNKKAEAEEKLAGLAEEIKSTEDAIKAAADREQSAREEIATAEEKRAEMLKQSISDWIAAQQEDEKGQEAVEKQNAKDSRRADRLRGKQDRGVRLSERDRDWLNKFDRRDLELREGGPLNAEEMAAQARDQQIAWQKNIEELQRKQTAVTEEIRDYLKEAVEVD